MHAKAVSQGDCLHLLLEAAQVPDQQSCVQIIRSGMQRLGVRSIRAVQIYGRRLGDPSPTWTQILVLKPRQPAAPAIEPVAPMVSTARQQEHDRTLEPSSSGVQMPRLPHPLKLPPSHSPIPPYQPPQRQAKQPARSAASQPVARRPPSGSSYKLKRSPRSPQRRLNIPILPLVSTSLLVGAAWSYISNSSNESAPTQLASPVVTTGLSDASPSPTSTTSPAVQAALPAAAPASPNQAATTITIKAVGDMILGTNFPNNRLPAQDGQQIFSNIKPFFGGADLVFGNFESTLTDYPDSAKDISQNMTFAFRTPPSYAGLLKQAGFNILNVANNHSMDFFEQGFEDTIKNIDQAGMQAVGKKGQILYTTVKGIPVAFIGFSYLDYHNSMNDLPAAAALVQEAKKQAKIVVISVHAGAEGTDAEHVSDRSEIFFGENRGNMVNFAHSMIDQGADLILGHGPHVPRAVELYKGKLIAYSLGNFVGYRTLSTQGPLGYSLILQVQMNEKGDFTAGRVIPVQLDGSGIPHLDDYFQSVVLVRNLTKSDFPQTPLAIDDMGYILRTDGQSGKP